MYRIQNFVQLVFEDIAIYLHLYQACKDSLRNINQLQEQQDVLKKKLDEMEHLRIRQMATELIQDVETINGVNYLSARLNMESKTVKDLAFAIKEQLNDLFLVLGYEHEGKPGLTVMVSDSLVQSKGLHAGNLVRELARFIDGGGGGQPFFATAGGKNPQGLDKAISESRKAIA